MEINGIAGAPDVMPQGMQEPAREYTTQPAERTGVDESQQTSEQRPQSQDETRGGGIDVTA